MARPWIELAHAPLIDSEPVPGSGWPVGPTIRVLSCDDGMGALSGVLSLPAGYRRGAGQMVAPTDFFVLSGTIRIGDAMRRFGYYEYAPAGALQEPWTVDAGCELLFMVNGESDFVPVAGEAAAPGRVQLDSETLLWDDTPIVPGPTPGLVRKLLRGDFETGERVALGSICPRWDYPKLEFHDCIEEIYSISGDLWLGNCGTMRAGSYLWRPPYITHGPFSSEEGGMFIVKVDNKLINHFTDDPRSTPEQNRAQADREFAEGVFTYPGRT